MKNFFKISFFNFILFIIFTSNVFLFSATSNSTLENYEKLLSQKYNVYKHYMLYGTQKEKDEAFIDFKNTVEKYKTIKDSILLEEKKKEEKKNTTTVKKYETKYGVVDVHTALNFRTGPNTTYSIIKTLPPGKNVKIIGETNGWYNVEIDGKTGYVSGKYIDIVKNGNTQKVENLSTPKFSYVNCSGLNFRTGPGLGNSVIKVLPNNKKMEVIGKTGDWLKVKVDGKTGYVHSSYVSDSYNTVAAKPSTTSTSSSSSGSSKVLNVPLINQYKTNVIVNGVNHGSSLCGPTAMSMVLNYHNVKTDMLDIAKKSNYQFATKAGTPVKGLVDCAKKEGFKNSKEVWSASLNTLKAEINANRPAIVLVDTLWKGHYVVVSGFKNGNVICSDPATGKVREWSESYFYNMWKARGRAAVLIKS